jgi:hypothetical protein
MRRMLLLILPVAAALAALSTPTYAQQTMKICVDGTNSANPGNSCVPVTSTSPLPVNASVSASVAVAPLTSSNLSSTVAVTNTFQSIQVSTAGRNGCLIQNQSTSNTMWVYFGAIGGATKAKSFQLDTSHGLAISCSVGGLGVLTDQVSITGTATDAFTANFQ